ncbi:S8 family peptidase [Streptomyces sp. NPDC052236]|uniref:S8 family peptidase n=1 Tax=Streptomyces sp. NPDC052236 TaxID=3365686 RepID=UPI0037D282C9
MYRKHRRLGTVVAAAALALVTGPAAVLPATAADEPATGRAAAGADNDGAPASVAHWITLVTGDRVGVDAKGKPVRIMPGKGREDIPIAVRRANGRTLVVPGDAQRLIDSGRVDSALFDVTELAKAEYRTRDRAGLGLIVSYGGPGAKAADAKAAGTLKAELREDGTAKVRRTFPRINAEALTVPAKSAGSVWETLTRTSGSGAVQRGAAPGLERISLDGIRKASLDRSVPQIGAPAAWAEGYDGKGVRIAVLDTGVDETHPDLQGRQEAEQNFSQSPDTKDRFGHGTHVAAIAAGTGAKSADKFRGVAPGARLLDGKVLDDDGFGSTSDILAGIDWAVSQNADIINLSLGAPDSSEIDPLEEAVNRISAEHGTLFVIAAGNSGPAAGTVESPGSAEAALTVGAVDKSDVIAESSSRGPRVGDGGVKPDVTAPGVSITAASASPGSVLAQRVGEQPPGYITISGTSMATPHAAGAAALLKQQHPEWTNTELKAVLATSARSGGAGVFAEGNGRIDVTAALKQTVVAEPTSVGFEKQLYPHADDKPETRKVTYRNLGGEPVTLDLSVSAVGPDSKPAAAGMFTLDAERVTVPAGGTATVDLTADTRPGGDVNGLYSATVTAEGAGQTVRTTATVERETTAYEVTVRHIGRDGEDTSDYWTSLDALTGSKVGAPLELPAHGDGNYTTRLPKGVYFLNTMIFGGTDDRSRITAPHFEVTEDTTVTLDARTAKPVDITGPDPAAERTFAEGFLEVKTPDTWFSLGSAGTSFKNFRTAQLGPDFSTGGTLFQQFNAIDVRGENEYHLTYGNPVTRLATGFERHAKAGDFAEVSLRLGASVPGKQGNLVANPSTEGLFGSIITPTVTRPLPATVKAFVTTPENTDWAFLLYQLGQQDDESFIELSHGAGRKTYEAGKAYHHDLGIAVFGPALKGGRGISREGDTITGCISLLTDGGGNEGFANGDTFSTTLYRDDVEVPSAGELLYCGYKATVPADAGRFRLTASATRGGAAAASTEVSATWTFTSGHTTAPEALPISVVRFTPQLAADSTAKAGAVTSVPVTVQGAAAGDNLKSLAVSVSYDGKTWKKVKVVKGKVTVRNPKAGQGISFRADVVDKQGNTLAQTLLNAYRGR